MCQERIGMVAQATGTFTREKERPEENKETHQLVSLFFLCRNKYSPGNKYAKNHQQDEEDTIYR